MKRYEVVNEIIDYLEIRKNELDKELHDLSPNTNLYAELEAMREVYDHLITKLEDDYR